MTLKESAFVKIVTSVPIENAEQVRVAMAAAGAGIQGNYSHCSGSHRSIGRFVPEVGAHPTVGSIGKQEEIEEEVVEMLCHRNDVAAVVVALRQTHPYEEPAIDIIPRLDVE